MSESPNWSNPLRDSRDLRLPRIAGPCSLVIFGVTGDLAQKKLLPAVYDLANRGLLPPSFGLTGFARRDWTQERFIEFVKAAVQAHCRTPFKESTWRNLAAGIRFVQGTFDDPEAFERLSATVQELDRDRGTQGNHAFYMSVPPRAFPQVAKQLAASGLSRSSEGAWRRVIIEKPFGHDLASAKELDSVVSEVFDPSSVFRIDHYLGKETVQNLLALRFANAMYEPIWNANYVDHVQITMAEDIGIGGRAGYYDGIGSARDVIQNHLLQLLALLLGGLQHLADRLGLRPRLLDLADDHPAVGDRLLGLVAREADDLRHRVALRPERHDHLHRRVAQHALAGVAADEAGDAGVGQRTAGVQRPAQRVAPHGLHHRVTVHPGSEARPHADDHRGIGDPGAQIPLGQDGVQTVFMVNRHQCGLYFL